MATLIKNNALITASEPFEAGILIEGEIISLSTHPSLMRKRWLP
ncbi:MAG: hypothetical protein ACOX7C_04435 [Brevefilum sp.]|jgi:hypothetical protein